MTRDETLRALVAKWRHDADYVESDEKDAAGAFTDCADELDAILAAPQGAVSVSYGDLPDVIRPLIWGHEWDNKNPCEQRDWLIERYAAALAPRPTPDDRIGVSAATMHVLETAEKCAHDGVPLSAADTPTLSAHIARLVVREGA